MTLPPSSLSSLSSSKVRFADDENLSTVVCEIPSREDLEDHLSDLFFTKSDFSETRKSAKFDSRECTVQHFLEGSFTVKSKEVQDQLNDWTREGPRGLERWSCKQHADERNTQQFEAVMSILQAQQEMLIEGDARFDYFAGKKRIGEIIQDDLIRKVALKVTRPARHFARMMGKADSSAAAFEFNNDEEVQQLAAEWDKYDALKRNSVTDEDTNSLAGNSMAESVNSSASSIMVGRPSLKSMGYDTNMLGSDLLLGSAEDVGLLDDEEEEDFGFLPQVDEVQKQDNEAKKKKKSKSSKRLSLLKKMQRRLSGAASSSLKASRRSSTGTSTSSRRSSATGSSKSSSKHRRASVSGSSSRRSSATGSTRRSSITGSSDGGMESSSSHRRSSANGSSRRSSTGSSSSHRRSSATGSCKEPSTSHLLESTIPSSLCSLSVILKRVEKLADGEFQNFEFLPSDVDGPISAARHQIDSLLQKGNECTEEDEDALDDGFFICDLNVVYRKLQAWRSLFPRVKPFFAVKCNPDPLVSAVLGCATDDRKGRTSQSTIHTAAGFDCASIPEIELALKTSCSQNPNKCIIYANPQRTEKDLEKALVKHNVLVMTFDGAEELHKIHRAYTQLLRSSEKCQLDAPPQLVLRILVPDENSSVPLGEKFGVAPDQIASLTRLSVDLKLPIIGVSFHCGSGNHDPESYVQAIQLAYKALEEIDSIQKPHGIPRCWLLDIGGGYPGADGTGASEGRFCGKRSTPLIVDEQGSETESARNISQAVTPLLDELFGNQDETLQVIAEPGRYFVEESFCLCSRIFRLTVDRNDETQEIIRIHYYIAFGVQGVFKDCLLCNETFTPTPLRFNKHSDTVSNGAEKEIPSTVHGPSGEEYDVICPDMILPELKIGDYLVFDKMGAYTLSIAARSGKPTVRYVVGGGQSGNSLVVV